MIEFEILTSPDLFVVGAHLYNRNVLTFGQKNCDINIQDDGLNPLHITLEGYDQLLFVHLAQKTEAILINKKRVTQTKKMNKNDIIAIGETQIKVINFSLTQYESQKSVILENLKKIKKDPLLNEIVEKTKEYLDYFHES